MKTDKNLIKQLHNEIDKLNEQIADLEKTGIHHSDDYGYHSNVQYIEELECDIEDLENQLKTLI